MTLKRNQKSNREKSKFSVNKFFAEKKTKNHQDLYKKLATLIALKIHSSKEENIVISPL